MPDTLAVLDPAPAPSRASRSRKSDQSSARLSLLELDPLCSNCDSAAADSDGVLGVRRNGDIGIRKLVGAGAADIEAPGLARPACSFCSVPQSAWGVGTVRMWLTFVPRKQSRNEL